MLLQLTAQQRLVLHPTCLQLQPGTLMIFVSLHHLPTPGQTLQSVGLALQAHMQWTSVARQLGCRLSGTDGQKPSAHSWTKVKCVTVVRVPSVVTLEKGFIQKKCHSKVTTSITPESCNTGIRTVSNAESICEGYVASWNIRKFKMASSYCPTSRSLEPNPTVTTWWYI